MEHEIILLAGMALAFFLGAKVRDFRLPHPRRKTDQENKEFQAEADAQVRALMSYTEADYKKHGPL